jgi:cytochrome c553
MIRYLAFVIFNCLCVSMLPVSVGAMEPIYFACASCHGEEGQGNPSKFAPALAGLEAEYIARQMYAFKSGGRGTNDDVHGQNMALIAKAYSDAQIEALATIIAKFQTLGSVKPITDPNYSECASCHGQAGEGNAAMGAPALRHLGQDYIIRQLQMYRAGARGNDTLGQLMVGAMSDEKWTDAAIERLAAIIARPD